MKDKERGIVEDMCVPVPASSPNFLQEFYFRDPGLGSIGSAELFELLFILNHSTET
jgi:hypothetical protein